MKERLSILVSHLERMRSKYPDDRLLMLLDFEGSVFDLTSLLPPLLCDFDANMDAELSGRIRVKPQPTATNRLEDLLATRALTSSEIRRVRAWYNSNYSLAGSDFDELRTFEGVLPLLSWLQTQPNVFVGIATSRPEELRQDTRAFLRRAAARARIALQDPLLAMTPSRPFNERTSGLAANTRYFQEQGFRIFAVAGVCETDAALLNEIDAQREILVLPFGPVFAQPKKLTTENTVDATTPDAAHDDKQEGFNQNEIPGGIDLAWTRVNDMHTLHNFLDSPIRWAEMDVFQDPISRDLILRRNSFEQTPLQRHEDILLLEVCLYKCRRHGRGIKLDFKEGGDLVDRVIEVVRAHDFPDCDLWFNGHVERFHEDGFRRLSEAFPEAAIQCPIHFMEATIMETPNKALEILMMLKSWGVRRFSINWLTQNKRTMIDCLTRWGFEVNIYNVPNHESFVQALHLLPRSISTDFRVQPLQLPLV